MGGEKCTVLGLRLMHKLALSRIGLSISNLSVSDSVSEQSVELEMLAYLKSISKMHERLKPLVGASS